MSTTTRVTLQDCKAELRLPAPITTKHTTPEAYTHETALSSHYLTECYIGSTVFLLLTLTPPTAPKNLLSATKSLSDLNVLLINPPTRETIRLPIVRESSWACCANQLVKGIWVLLRSPPAADDSRPLATAGKQNIVVSVRENTASPRNSSVWATIDRAGRLFAKSVALKAMHAVILAMPIQISCHAVCVGGSADRTFISVTVKNATSDAYLSVVPPHINLASSRIVKELERDQVGKPVQLEGDYEFVPMFGSQSSEGEDKDAHDGAVKHQESGESCEDYGLFIPSFNHLLRCAVKLGPREVYNFAYRVVQNTPSRDAEGEARERLSEVRLQQGECVESNVAVAWSCSKTEEEEDIGDGDMSLQRELSAGHLLATGERGNVAVYMTSVKWRPVSLLGGMVVTVSGPQTARVGETVQVSISLVNQTEQAIDKVCVRIQEKQIEHNLLALRTVISVGRIAAGGETNLQLPCLTVESGAQGLGRIAVVEENIDGSRVWVTESEYKVLVLEESKDGSEEDNDASVVEELEALVAR